MRLLLSHGAAIAVLSDCLLGRSLATIPGGKGANQAVSCARQGAAVQMIGCIGRV